jgi:hypothetical protein
MNTVNPDILQYGDEIALQVRTQNHGPFRPSRNVSIHITRRTYPPLATLTRFNIARHSSSRRRGPRAATTTAWTGGPRLRDILLHEERDTFLSQRISKNCTSPPAVGGARSPGVVIYLAVSGMWWARPSSRTRLVSASRSRSGPASDVLYAPSGASTAFRTAQQWGAGLREQGMAAAHEDTGGRREDTEGQSVQRQREQGCQSSRQAERERESEESGRQTWQSERGRGDTGGGATEHIQEAALGEASTAQRARRGALRSAVAGPGRGVWRTGRSAGSWCTPRSSTTRRGAPHTMGAARCPVALARARSDCRPACRHRAGTPAGSCRRTTATACRRRWRAPPAGTTPSSPSGRPSRTCWPGS